MIFPPLTPGRFLTLQALNSCRDPYLNHLKLNIPSRFPTIEFWLLETLEPRNINTLQQLSKWSCYKSLRWLLGMIVELHLEHDGQVRVFTLKITQCLTNRPSVKLCSLPVTKSQIISSL